MCCDLSVVDWRGRLWGSSEWTVPNRVDVEGAQTVFQGQMRGRLWWGGEGPLDVQVQQGKGGALKASTTVHLCPLQLKEPFPAH